MNAAPRTLVVYVDVDDTLVRSFGSKQIPMPATVDRVRALAAQDGVALYCWSSGGAEYAERVAVRLGIAALFIAFLPKPNVMVDDMALSDWRDLLVVHPNEAAHLDAPAARALLGRR